MEYTIKQLSSLEKVRNINSLPENELREVTLLAGETFSYQVCGFSECSLRTELHIESELSDYLKRITRFIKTPLKRFRETLLKPSEASTASYQIRPI